MKIQIITSCTGEKLHKPDNQLKQDDFRLINSDEQSFRQKVNQLSAFQIEAESPLPPRTSHCNSHEQIGTDIRVRFRISYDVWILNLFDAGRAKGHFESRQRSTCRPDSRSSNLCASTADSECSECAEGATDGCRRLIESCQLGRGSAWTHVGPLYPTAHCAQVCLLPTKFVSNGTSCSRSDFWNTDPFHLVFLLIDLNCCE